MTEKTNTTDAVYFTPTTDVENEAKTESKTESKTETKTDSSSDTNSGTEYLSCHSTTSPQQSVSPRIRNFEHFALIITEYGRHVFEDMEAQEDLLNFIVDRIILFTDSFYDEAFQIRVLRDFIKVMSQSASIENISTVNRGELLVHGTFGNIYESLDSSEVCHKACRVDHHHLKKIKARPADLSVKRTDDPKNEIFEDTNADYISGRNNTLSEYMFEISNYIIWKSLSLYLKDHTNESQGENDFPEIGHYLAPIHRIYYIEESIKLNGNRRFRLGYSMERQKADSSAVLKTLVNRIEHYKKGIEMTRQEIEKDDSDVVGLNAQEVLNNCHYKIESKKRMIRNIYLKTYEMFDKFRVYDRYGISLVHRDSSTKNVMINRIDDKELNETLTLTKFIDFSVLQAQIEFADGISLIIGHFFTENYNRRTFKYYDHIMFALFARTYALSSMKMIDISDDVESLLKLNTYSYLVDLNDPISVWLYPYRVIFDGKEFSRKIQERIKNEK